MACKLPRILLACQLKPRRLQFVKKNIGNKLQAYGIGVVRGIQAGIQARRMLTRTDFFEGQLAKGNLKGFLF